jgi:hypothetical protein
MQRNLTIVLVALALAAIGIAAVVAVGSNGEPAAAGTPGSASPEPPTSDVSPAATTPPSEVIVEAEPILPGNIAQVTGAWATDWTRRTIEFDELAVGIPASDPRDAIRPLDFPAYETVASGSEWLVDNEIGVLLELDGVARFHPLRILTAHEVVNDELGGVAYALTYCPLCNTAAAFDRRVDGRVLRFGVSGLLRLSDLVMWDDATESLWQQITGEGIVGEHAGTQLTFLPTATITWGDFTERHPAGEVLSIETGSRFNYGTNGYVGYSTRGPIGRFFGDEADPRFPAMERVVGVRVGTATKAYPFSVLVEAPAVNDALASTPITVWWADTGAADNFDSARPGEGRVIGTGIAFLATVDGQALTFEAAGDGTFRDTDPRPTWTLFGEAVEGPLAGTQLEPALHQNEFWFAWAAFNEGAPVHGG